jgi:VanZ like family
MSRSRPGGVGSSGGSNQQTAPHDPQLSDVRVRDLAPPLAVALLIVTTSPVMRQVRDLLLESLGARFAGVLAIGLGATIGAAIVGAALRIREPRPVRRWLRFGGLGLALALLGIQIFGFGTGNPLIDAVEHFHLIEYGLLGALFYRAFRRYRDSSALPLTVLAVTLVGIVDELVQWWTPVRVGDARDVVLNAYAGLCGMLFGLALAPPEGWVLRGGRAAARRVGWAAALTCLAFALFYDRAHLGHEITDPEIGHFRDWHSRERLLELKAERAAQWAAHPPTGLEIAGPEDFYLTAAIRHVAYRDESLANGDWFHAWKENLIVETYYTPYLELRSFDGIPVQNRLAPEQRQQLEAERPRPDPVSY